MRGSHFGKMLSITTFGESHGPALGVVIDGVPPRLKVSLADLKRELARRAPGKSATTSARQEADLPEILSGTLKNETLGTPIAVIVRNTDQRSSDYAKRKTRVRLGHADQTYLDKYGIHDHRGSGRASGRETVARVIAGYFASLIIPKVKVKATTYKIGPCLAATQAREIEALLLKCKAEGDSVGGQVAVTVDHCPKGLGEPVFDKLKADLAKAMLSIGGCTSFSYGLGEDFSLMTGKELARIHEAFGGIEAGISNGRRITFLLTFKAPSTVGKQALQGRHDPCIIPRVLPVVEAMTTLVLADHFLRQKAYAELK